MVIFQDKPGKPVPECHHSILDFIGAMMEVEVTTGAITHI